MFYAPKNILSTLEFDKILKLTQSFCIGSLAKQYFEKPKFLTNINQLEVILMQIEEMRNSLQSDSQLSIFNYNDVSKHLENLKINGFVLTIEALQEINNILKGAKNIKSYFTSVRKEIYPTLGQLSNLFYLPKEIINIIDDILDKEGEIKVTASPELMRISRVIRSKQIEINKVFNGIVSDLKNRGLLSDTVETYRNGRRVLTLPVENKRKIKGIIHDESATGKTVYIEPELIIELNNDLFHLEGEYKKEVYKILKKLSDQLRPYIDIINTNLDLIAEFDIIASKSKLAISLNANRPLLVPKPILHLSNAFHPLLYLKNKNIETKTIPFDLKLEKNNRIVVISGPNAGGKSITLKTVGLLQLMTQAGFLIPVKEDSKIGIFKKIFADIGDQQSVEDDLSTYSSRLRNMKLFLENVDDQSMVLIDEFGSGTDPKIGGAIAEAILKELHKLKSWGVITTHYSNIKIFAFKTKGIINAAMHFDKKNIIPTYHLNVGKPGSSFAFEIAQNTGLSKRVLNYARFKSGKNIKKIEELLVELQRDKADLQEKLLVLKDKEIQFDKLIKKYNELHKDLDFKKKKFKIEQKELSLIELNKNNKEIQNLIREIRTSQKIEEAKKLAQKIAEKKEKVLEESKTLKKTVSSANKNEWKKLKVGDYVKLKSGNIYGQITKIKKEKADIQTGIMTISVPIHELSKANKPISINSSASIKTSINRKSKDFEATIDIRGYSKSEALESLQEYFDNALLANASLLKILHGKGNGILRNTVKEIASDYSDIEELWHPSMDQGGDGITFVKLK